MLNDTQVSRMLGKLTRLEQTLEPMMFTEIGQVPVKRLETAEHFRAVPPESAGYRETKPGDTWGGEWMNCWFRGRAAIPERYRGQSVYVMPKAGGYEGLLWVDGEPRGNFTGRDSRRSHGNHYCDLLVKEADPSREIDVAIELYAGHYIIGTQPFETEQRGDFRFTFEKIALCVKNQDIADFIYDLRALNQLAECLEENSFRRAEVVNCLTEVHKVVYYSPEDAEESQWRPALARAREIMAPLLAARNSASAPVAGLVGHSHMDTAWLWPLAETVRKCARTYANQISLMDQFPEYRFVQSSAYHGEMMRRNYPTLFAAIQQKVAEGRYEPNGGVWVECDCNITSGESMVRQFLWGQRFTRKYFGYTSNCFWLPDTFGYSPSIPQIMKGSRIDYFLTTKMSWNDTNRFPYETFYWKGIDGTAVFTHFNAIHCWPDPKTLLERVPGRPGTNALQNKRTANRRLISYGYGDGGGGPQFEMIEMSRRVRDLEGCPRAEHTGVGDFMRGLERDAVDAPVYQGDLYLELHRGTLTNQHEIKRNNRLAEQALHDLEVLTVRNAVRAGAVAGDEHIRPLMETLLVNQFHDILPGTCITAVHEQNHREMADLLRRAAALLADACRTDGAADAVTVFNTLGFARSEPVYLDAAGKAPADGALRAQRVPGLDGVERLCVAGLALPALGGAVVALREGAVDQPSAFTYENGTLTTPFARVAFEADGTIGSFVDTRAHRELRGAGLPLNTFLLAEDVPTAWDNWDIDADIQLKLRPTAELVDRRVVSDGSVQFRLRSTYRLSAKSTVTQDMVFYADTPRVDFETVIDWHDRHRFLKVGFDTTVRAGTARNEVQFGYSQRPTTRNNSIEQAMFEVVNHRYTDLSETRYGVAVLNDCKYGVSVEGGDIRLSLHKGGARPDTRADEGTHRCTYSLLPHVGGFAAETVVQPAYSLNYRPLVARGAGDCQPLAWVDAPNVVIETVKPCEDNDRAFILRLYEAEGTYTRAALTLGCPCTGLAVTNLLEETERELPAGQGADLEFRPFEIKTLRVSY